MWHSIVSGLNQATNRLIGGFVATCHQYPIATLCCLAAFAVLTVAFWLELLQIRRSARGPAVEPAAFRLRR